MLLVRVPQMSQSPLLSPPPKAARGHSIARTSKKAPKRPWTTEEDRIVSDHVMTVGRPAQWSKCAQKLPGRIGKNCRERWYNHLNPSIKRTPWTSVEDDIIIRAQAQLGNQWSQIAKQLPGRSDLSCKNHWNSTMQRRIQRFGRDAGYC